MSQASLQDKSRDCGPHNLLQLIYSKPMDSEFHTISKLEAAERQLRQAVRLFFQRGDDLAIHTLAAATYQIISDLCKQKGIQREVENSPILEEMGVKDEVLVFNCVS